MDAEKPTFTSIITLEGLKSAFGMGEAKEQPPVESGNKKETGFLGNTSFMSMWTIPSLQRGQEATYPRSRSGGRNESMVSSSYDVYGKKLFAKEGGLRYDLFTGESKPSQPLDKLTIGQLKELQRKRSNTAAGAYQFTLATVEDVQKEMGLKDTDVFSPATQNRMFETFTRGNETRAREVLGMSRVSDAQRYSMHFLGRSGGVSFLRKLRENPNATFAKEFPNAYARNKAMFSKIGGANATLADAFGELSRRMK